MISRNALHSIELAKAAVRLALDGLERVQESLYEIRRDAKAKDQSEPELREKAGIKLQTPKEFLGIDSEEAEFRKCRVCNGAGRQAVYGVLLGDGTAGVEQEWVFIPCSACHGSGKSFFAVAAELDEILEEANTKV